MTVDHEGVRDLIAAWTLGATLPTDEPRLLAHLAECERCAAEADQLREAVRLLDGEPQASGVPGAADSGEGAHAMPVDPTRTTPVASILATALRSRPATPRVAPHAAPYAAAVSGLLALLRELGEEGPWSTPVVHDWDVHATLAHLVAADEPLGLHLGLPPCKPRSVVRGDAPWQDAWAARTGEVIAHEHRRAPGATVATWQERTARLLAAPEALDPQLAAPAATLLGVRMPVAEHYLVRAFETWVHTDDIGRALGRSVPPPPDPQLWQLVTLAVRILDLALGSTAPPVLLTVSGAGGETQWVLGSEADPVAAELVLDPVDFCLLIGGRYAPADVPRGLAGDPDAGQGVLERAASLAWL
ncbi:maleylpyruvate isomerase family mycothiol-dependent enzyme [Streptomyces sp. NBC_01304]|uniref:maleylpyruvate isomerase family mycothiol-dependent enzyme n=1 Tax=Streptomyces sp. NBC_01304 TaxID=2903818 RepID=UPI002E0DF060|nr:maleylpyruvate isomerase family mycothiol-dependent enzyme [Streptomyces sp. NBC_01304]